MSQKNFAGRGKVAIVRTSPQTVLDDYARLMELADYRAVLPQQHKTLLKINISWQTWYPACSTTPWQLEGVIRKLQADGYKDLLGVHNDTVVVDTGDGERNNKQRYVTDKYGVPCVYIYKPEAKWVPYQPKESFLVLDSIYPEGVTIPEILIGNNIIQMPTVKTHVFTTITGAMKNAFGGLLGRKRHWTHSVIHETLVDLLMIQQDIHPGLFAVMDGSFAGDGPGPRAMRWHEKNILLASADQVAIDATSAMLQGFDPMNIPFIRIAHDLGLGVGNPHDIEFVGDVDATEERWNFIQEDTFASRGQKMIYHGALKPFEEVLLRGPIVPWSYFASNFYHNVYWYPVVGRKRVQEALKTPWGQLFSSYGADAGLEGAVLPSVETKTLLQGAAVMAGAGLALGGLIGLLTRQRKS
ncbi:MAG: DUF362 domain-containing protein [Anaerolineae bacterium]|jgi:uncharacterized protein (DUF362 family)|nr:DUF362 domain-containing protein [Anaerolineae bacterium]